MSRQLIRMLQAVACAVGGSAFTLALVGAGPAGLTDFLHGRPEPRAESPMADVVHNPANPLLPAPTFAAHPALGAQPGSNASLADVAERVVHGVVNISSSRTIRGREGDDSPFRSDPFFERFFGQPGGSQMQPERRQQSLGSGVIIDRQGTVLTNNHVVQGADEIKVTLDDDSEVTAKVIGRDPKSDLAVLKLEGDAANLAPISFGDSNRLRLGDVVLAVGNPFGVGRTVTMGIVSATGRANVGITDYEDFIQTDAAINPGNSGGALVDMEGNLIGINTAILSRTGGNQGVGFAIPSNMAQTIARSLITKGKVERGWLGVAIQDLDGDLGKALNMSGTKGVLISDVVPDGPAAKAGLQRGDVVVKVDGQNVDSSGRLRNLIASRGSAVSVTLGLLREGKEREVKVKLGELPAEALDPQQAMDEGVLSGVRLEGLSDEVRRKFDLPDRIKAGVVVSDVAQGSHAQQLGFRPGDVILEVNRAPVKSVTDVQSAYEKSHDRVLMLVFRQGSTVYLVVPKK